MASHAMLHKCHRHHHDQYKVVEHIRCKNRELENKLRERERNRLLTKRRQIVLDTEFPELLQRLRKRTNIKDTILVLQELSQYMENNSGEMAEIIKDGEVLRKVVGSVSSSGGGSSEAQLWALECLSTICRHCPHLTQRQCALVAKAGGAYLVNYMLADNVTILQYCIWCVSDLISHSNECAKILICQGLIPSLMHWIHAECEPVILSGVTGCLSTLLSGDQGALVAEHLRGYTEVTLQAPHLVRNLVHIITASPPVGDGHTRRLAWKHVVEPAWLLHSLAQCSHGVSGSVGIEYVPALVRTLEHATGCKEEEEEDGEPCIDDASPHMQHTHIAAANILVSVSLIRTLGSMSWSDTSAIGTDTYDALVRALHYLYRNSGSAGESASTDIVWALRNITCPCFKVSSPLHVAVVCSGLLSRVVDDVMTSSPCDESLEVEMEAGGPSTEHYYATLALCTNVLAHVINNRSTGDVGEKCREVAAALHARGILTTTPATDTDYHAAVITTLQHVCKRLASRTAVKSVFH